MRNKQRRPGGGGAAAFVLADRSQFSTYYAQCHAFEEIEADRGRTAAARWIVRRYGVRPGLAETIAAMAGFGARS